MLSWGYQHTTNFIGNIAFTSTQHLIPVGANIWLQLERFGNLKTVKTVILTYIMDFNEVSINNIENSTVNIFKNG